MTVTMVIPNKGPSNICCCRRRRRCCCCCCCCCVVLRTILQVGQLEQGLKITEQKLQGSGVPAPPLVIPGPCGHNSG